MSLGKIFRLGLCSLAVFLVGFIGVSAKILDIEVVAKEFNEVWKTSGLKEIGVDLEARVDEENKALEICNKDEVAETFNYDDESISLVPKFTDVTKENCLENISVGLHVTGVTLAILNASGYEGKTIELPEDFVPNYDTHGLEMVTEPFSFVEEEEGNTSSVSGNFIKGFKMTLNTAKIDKLVSDYGKVIDLGEEDKKTESSSKSLVPKLRIDEISDTTVQLTPSFEGSTADEEEVFCYLYRSRDRDDGYEKISDMAFNCSGEFKVIDENLASNATYYYKSQIQGGSIYSEPIMAMTKAREQNNIEGVDNPQTGVYSKISVLIVALFSLIGIRYFKKHDLFPRL